jgi:hypothetical protein
MFTFVLKENKIGLEILITRILLAVAGIVVLLYANDINYTIKIAAAVTLLLGSYFVQIIAKKLKISRFAVLLIAAGVLWIGTHSFIFTGILCCYGALLNFLQKKPEVIIDEDKIVLKKIFKDDVFEWVAFTNVILKDGLLTLDFTDNKLLQLNIDDHETAVHENLFNSFCSERLAAAK